MVWAARAEGGQLRRPLAACELERILVIGVVGDHRAVGGHRAAKRRQDCGGNLLSVRKRLVLNAPKQGALFLLMPEDEFTHLVDGSDAVQIALALRVAPCE